MTPVLHYVRFDAPGANGRHARAVCGQQVNPKIEHAAEPTCPTCVRWLQDFEALDLDADPFGPPTPGTQVHTTLLDTLAGYKPKGMTR